MNYEEYVENLSMRDWCDEDERERYDEDEWNREYYAMRYSEYKLDGGR